METLKNLYKRNPRTIKTISALSTLYILNKLYQKWKYSQKLFSKQDIQNKVILITGCDTGFGNAIALKLSIKYGYRVLATCLKQESVDKFNSNALFTQNKSTSLILDVLDDKNIKSVLQFTIKYLNETSSILWGLVNNAGFGIPGQFELVPIEYDNLERNILFSAPLNIIRTFLPLIYGRLNYKNDEFNCNKTCNNGGRIVNMSSSSARFIFGEIRYGPSKAALSYISHVLRMELSTRFGIWVAPVEPGGYNTNIFKSNLYWTDKLKNKLKDNNETELMDIYEFDADKLKNLINKMGQGPGISNNLDEVVDDVIHGLIAKYPKRYYNPGWHFGLKLMIYAPLWITEPLQIQAMNNLRKDS